MNIAFIMLFITSLSLILLSSWNVNLFIKLNNASSQTPTDSMFKYSCNLSKTYVKSGLIISTLFLLLSVSLFVISSIHIYRSFSI